LPAAAALIDRTEPRLEERGGTFSTGSFATGRSMPLFPPRRPKKRGPFHDVPVMARAIAERLG
jgi:hypothetical protein